MKLTIEAETDEERKRFPEPVIWPGLERFGVAGFGVGGGVRKIYGWWPDIQGDLAALHAQVEWEIRVADLKHQSPPVVAVDRRKHTGRLVTRHRLRRTIHHRRRRNGRDNGR